MTNDVGVMSDISDNGS